MSGPGAPAGLPDLRDTLDRARARLGDLEPAHRVAGEAIAARARPPRRTGRLAASVTVTTSADGVTVSYPVRYAFPVHVGVPSRNMAANPFLAAAFTIQTDALIAGYSADLSTLYT